MSISTQMRQASSQDHKNAESMFFIRQLMEGKLSVAAYVGYLVQLAFIYQALERHFENSDVLPYSRSLLRFPSILLDLEALGVKDFSERDALPATLEYVSRIQELGGEQDPRLLAHHYTRYLGDLSGGQAIAVLVKRHYDINDSQLAFYNFPEIENLVRFKEDYRAALDSAHLTGEALQTLLAEVQVAFRLNQAVFAQLGDQFVSFED